MYMHPQLVSFSVGVISVVVAGGHAVPPRSPLDDLLDGHRLRIGARQTP